MNFLRLNSRLFQVSSLYSRRLLSNNLEADVLHTRQRNSEEFYMKLLNLDITNVRLFLKHHGSLAGSTVNFYDVKITAEYLKALDFTNRDIMERPMALLINKITIANRRRVLEECCFKQYQLMLFCRFVSVMNKDIKTLKALSYMPPDANVADSLVSCLDMPITIKNDLGDYTTLNKIREKAINAYLKAKLGVSERDILKIWRVYTRLRHRSLQSIMDMINLLINDLNFTPERIIKNAYLLYGCPDNIQKLLIDVPQIADVPMKEILWSRPKIAMQNANSIKSSVSHIVRFDIPEDRILKCVEVLTLGPDTVYERLIALKDTKEFHVLVNHPRILRLIHYQKKALTRLDYLKQLKVKCASLHVLSSSSDSFEKYAREGIDRTKGRDGVYYVAKAFTLDHDHVRNVFSRHPNWCHVSLLSIKAALDLLRYKKFSLEDIAENLIILLYPTARIEQKLNALLEWKAESNNDRMISGVALTAISNSKMLNLCLYFIEAEFHFSGDGIWEPLGQNMNKSDLYQTTIPEFPKSLVKTYKYGVQKKGEIQNR